MGGALQKAGHVRRAYNQKLKQALKQGMNGKQSHEYRRQLGKELKEATPRPLRDAIYKYNEDRYGKVVDGKQIGDKYGPFYDSKKHDNPVKNLTDTNRKANTLQYVPSRGVGPASSAIGGALSSALRGCGCE